MDTGLIEAFVVVADKLSFTRAAEQLGIGQPLLSRAIRRLEDLVGEELIDRRSRQIGLTAAGAAFLEEAQNVLDQLSVAVRRANRAGRGSPSLLRIGYTVTVQTQVFHRGISRFRDLHPEVTLDLVMMSGPDLTDALRAGGIDFGMLPFNNYDRHNLTWTVIGRVRLILATPASWSLPSDQPVDLATLRNAPFIFVHPSIGPDTHAAAVACCDAAGFQPQTIHYVSNPAELRFLVANGVGAGFDYETTLLTQADGIRVLPLANPPDSLFVDFYLAWRQHQMSRLSEAFIGCMTEETYAASIVQRDGRFSVEWRRAVF